MRRVWLAVPILGAIACSDYNGVGSGSGLVDPPSNLTYEVEPSGTPGSPTGVLLHWDFDNNSDLAVWHVYSRGGTNESYRLRGSTTSNSFHDEGIPHLQYYVTAEDVDGFETSPSNVVTVEPSPLTTLRALPSRLKLNRSRAGRKPISSRLVGARA